MVLPNNVPNTVLVNKIGKETEDMEIRWINYMISGRNSEVSIAMSEGLFGKQCSASYNGPMDETDKIFQKFKGEYNQNG